MRLFLFFFFVVFLVSKTMSGTIDPNINDNKYIEYGKRFKCVAKLCGKSRDGKNYCASSVIIKPRWAITAAHVVNDIETCELTVEDKKVAIEKIIKHKDFKYEEFGEYDIALCKTSENIDLDSYPKLYTNHDEEGKVCSISGYGISGTFLTGCTKFDGKRRAGLNNIDVIHKHILICSPSTERCIDITELEFLIGVGDSGGGLFIDSELAGINSGVMAADKKPDSSYGDEGCHTRISIFADWINNTIENND